MCFACEGFTFLVFTIKSIFFHKKKLENISLFHFSIDGGEGKKIQLDSMLGLSFGAVLMQME